MKPGIITPHTTEIIPVNYNKTVADKTAEIFEMRGTVKERKISAKEKPSIASYYDELHFANYE